MKNSYQIENLNNPKTAIEIEDLLNMDDHISYVTINFNKKRIIVESNLGSNEYIYIKKLLKEIDKELILINPNKKNNNEIFLIIISIILGTILGVLGLKTNINLLVIISYIIIITNIITKIIIDLIDNKVLRKEIIIVIVSIGIYFTNYLKEGLIIVLLYELSQILKIILEEITNKNIEKFTTNKIDKVTIKRDNSEIIINPENINKGDIIVIKSGDKIPVEGIVKKGTTTIDTSTLTGKSTIKKVKEGDIVNSGCNNLFNTIEIEATSDYENSISTITKDTIESSIKKPLKKEPYIKINNIISIIIIIISVLYCLISILILDKNIKETIYYTLSILLIAETTNSIITIPILYNIGVVISEYRGIIIKDRNNISKLFNIKKVIFSKTNIFTKEKNKEYYLNIKNKKYSKHRILNYYAKGEYSAAKPFTNVIDYYDIKPSRRGITEYKETKKTITYIYKKELIEIEMINDKQYNLSINNKLVSELCVKEGFKEEALITLEQLNKYNIKSLIITDEEEDNIKDISKELNIDSIKYGLNNDEKYIELKQELIRTKGNTIYISNELRDASSLEISDIGITLNSYNNRIVSLSSDISIKDDDLTKLITLLNIIKKIKKSILIHLLISYIIKLILIILLILNIIYVPIIILIDIFITIITILDSNRLIIGKE